MKKIFNDVTGKRLIVFVYILVFALLSITLFNIITDSSKINGNYERIIEIKINTLIGLTMLLLIMLGVMVVKNVKKIDQQNKKLVEKDKILNESERLYKELFNKSLLPKWVCDRRTLQFYEVNDTAIKHYGYSREEFLNLTVFDLRLKEDHEKIKKYVQSDLTAAGNESVRKHVKKDGEIIWVEILLNEIRYKGKEAVLAVVTDVTRKLESERKLRQEEEFYRTIMANSSDVQLITDGQGKIIYASSSLFKNFGFNKEEIMGKTCYDFWHPDDIKVTGKKIRKLVDEPGTYIQVEVRYLNKEKNYRWCEARISNQLHNPAINGYVSNYSDINERKLAEQKLLESEANMRAILENTNTAFFLMDTDFRIVEFNHLSYQFTLEETGKELRKGTHYTEYMKEDRKESLLQIYQEALSGRDVDIELKGYRKDKWYHVTMKRIAGDDNKVLGLCISSVDVSEQKIAKEKIKNSEELYRSLFNKSPLPIFVADKEKLQYLEVNNMAVELYGYSREEFLNLTLFDIRPEKDHPYLQGIIDAGALSLFKNNHVQHIKKNGGIMIVDVALDTINYKGREAYLVIVNDITLNLQLQQQLNEEKLNKQIEITKATISGQEKERNELGKELHDNVNQILATAKLYLESSIVTPNKQNEFIEMGKNLINSGINEIRKISKSLVPPSLGDLTLREALKELIEPVKLTKKTIQLKTTGFDEEKLCNGLKISVYRIVQEQLNNIMKYAEASKVCISIKQAVDELELDIIDNGKGFDPAKKRNGIGITNIINRAATFNGKVVVDSTPGNGCRINANFKLAAEHQKELQYLFNERNGHNHFQNNTASSN